MQIYQVIAKMPAQVLELVGHILKCGSEGLCMECIQMNFIGELILPLY